MTIIYTTILLATAILDYQRENPIPNPFKPPLSYGFPMVFLCFHSHHTPVFEARMPSSEPTAAWLLALCSDGPTPEQLDVLDR